MTEYCIGIEDHYAWANLVSVSIDGSNEVLLDRRRVELLDASLPASPYHHDTLRMTSDAGERLVREAQAAADRRAASALASLVAELAPATCRGVAIRVPPLASLPVSVAAAHADARVVNRADGMIYHRALTEAAARLELKVFYFERATAVGLAAEARATTEEDLERRLRALGTARGASWRKGQIVACAGAMLACESVRRAASVT